MFVKQLYMLFFYLAPFALSQRFNDGYSSSRGSSSNGGYSASRGRSGSSRNNGGSNYGGGIPEIGSSVVVPIIRDEREGPNGGVYSFLYETGDGLRRHEEGSPDGPNGAVVQRGGWTFTYPDGTPAEFSFVADENGYQVVSDLLPTPHPLPAHAVEQIEKAEREKAQDRFSSASQQRGSYAAPSQNSFSPQSRPQNSYSAPSTQRSTFSPPQQNSYSPPQRQQSNNYSPPSPQGSYSAPVPQPQNTYSAPRQQSQSRRQSRRQRNRSRQQQSYNRF